MELAQVDIGSAFPPARIDAFRTLGGFISYFLPMIFLVGAVITFGIIVVAGIGLIAGAGNQDPHAMESRKNILTYAVIGLIIMLGSYFVIQILNYITHGALGSFI